MPHWVRSLPQPVLFGAAIFGVCAAALALSVPVVWFRNWRRMVPELWSFGDFAKAFAGLLLVSLLAAFGAGLGLAVLEPLCRIGPGVAALPGGIVIAVGVLLLAMRRFARGG